MGRAEIVLVFGVLQAAIGYTQYLTGVPEVLVALHILGATLVWSAVLWFFLGLSRPDVTRADLDHDDVPAGSTLRERTDGDDDANRDGSGRDLVTGRG